MKRSGTVRTYGNQLSELYAATNLEPVKWKELELADTGGDACLWIGSVGAETKLHRDAYGWNCVAQLYGRKLWRLAPKECNIMPSRIPYEESTIWGVKSSKNEILTKSINSVIEIVLKPGELLVIPPGWWHEVKSLDTSVSINIWTAEPKLDQSERAKEAATRMIGALCQGRIETPSIESEFGSIEELRKHLPKSNLPLDAEHQLFHALTHPKVIETFLSVYTN